MEENKFVWLEYTAAEGQICKPVLFERGTDIRSALELLAADSFTETNIETYRFSIPAIMLKAKKDYEAGGVYCAREMISGDFQPVLYIVNVGDKEKKIFDERARKTAEIIERLPSE